MLINLCSHDCTEGVLICHNHNFRLQVTKTLFRDAEASFHNVYQLFILVIQVSSPCLCVSYHLSAHILLIDRGKKKNS